MAEAILRSADTLFRLMNGLCDYVVGITIHPQSESRYPSTKSIIYD